MDNNEMTKVIPMNGLEYPIPFQFAMSSVSFSTIILMVMSAMVEHAYPIMKIQRDASPYCWFKTANKANPVLAILEYAIIRRKEVCFSADKYPKNKDTTMANRMIPETNGVTLWNVKLKK